MLEKSSIFDQLTHAKSFKEISYNLHFLVISILLVQNICVAVCRLGGAYDFIFTMVNLSEISLYLFSIILFKKRYYDTSILVIAFGLPIVFAYCIFCIANVTLMSCLWFILAFQIIYTIIISKNQHRIFYLIYCAVIFHIPGVIIAFGDDFIATLIKFVQLGTLNTIPVILASFFERQDANMQSLNKELIFKYTETEEQAQKLNKKNSELVVYSHIMSHDLKAPLQTIKAFNELLKEDYKKIATANIEKLKYFNIITSSVDAMSDLINNLLMYSKLDQKNYEFESVDLNDIMQQVLLLFSYEIEKKNIQIKIKHLPVIMGNVAIIKTVFQNLISNAIKFQPKEKKYQPKLCIETQENKENYVIFFKDNGIGIKPENVDDLFTPFERFHNASEYKGTGLGMSICKKIMHIHQGEIQLVNSNEKGSTFKLLFPKTVD